MSKAEEFEALQDRMLNAHDEEGAKEAAKALLLYAFSNRALIARALRYAKMIESPSNDLRIEITNAVTNRAIYDPEDNLYHTPKLGDAALSVLREAVK